MTHRDCRAFRTSKWSFESISRMTENECLCSSTAKNEHSCPFKQGKKREFMRFQALEGIFAPWQKWIMDFRADVIHSTKETMLRSFRKRKSIFFTPVCTTKNVPSFLVKTIIFYVHVDRKWISVPFSTHEFFAPLKATKYGIPSPVYSNNKWIFMRISIENEVCCPCEKEN